MKSMGEINTKVSTIPPESDFWEKTSMHYDRLKAFMPTKQPVGTFDGALKKRKNRFSDTASSIFKSHY